MLFPRSRITRFLQYTKDCSSGPSIKFSFRFKLLKLFSFPYIAGMWPCNLFIFKFKTERNLLKLPMHWGILPLKWLNDKSSTSRDVMLQMEVGIFPANWFFAPENNSKIGDNTGRNPENKLEPRSRNCRFFHGSDSVFVRKLWEIFKELSESFPTSHNHLGTSPYILSQERYNISKLIGNLINYGYTPISPENKLFPRSKNQDVIVPFKKLLDKWRPNRLEQLLPNRYFDELYEENLVVKLLWTYGSWPMKLLYERSMSSSRSRVKKNHDIWPLILLCERSKERSCVRLFRSGGNDPDMLQSLRYNCWKLVI